jgi:glycosyltransferase involved in cell wall biosynthesis
MEVDLMGRPSITVGMPVRNNVRTIRRAVRSIQLQTVPDWELLLVDDGSTDGTLGAVRDLLCDPRIRIFSDGKALGISSRLNQTLDIGRGRYYARMDGDDVSYPERFLHQLQFLQSNPEVNLVGAQMLIVGENGRVLGERRGPLTHDAICHHPSQGFRMFHPTYFGHLEWFRVHHYANVRRCEDQELLLRTCGHSKFGNIDVISLGYHEERLKFRACLCGRYNFVRAVTRAPEMSAVDAAMAVAGNASKATLDALAVASGLGPRLLPQRCKPTTQGEVHRWQSVWRSVKLENHDH